MATMIYNSGDDPGVQVVEATPNTLSFSNKDDWAGDSELGFGAIVVVELGLAQVVAMHTALGEWIKERTT